jgi:hypothetical protein
MKQREAVYSATKSVLADAGIKFEDGADISLVMTEGLRSKITAIVCGGFKAGTVDLKDTPSNKTKLSSEPELNSYVSGLISNWFRKDIRFNGGVSYEPKNPGSRTGSTDPQLKALRQLHKQFLGVDAEKATQIQGHINSRLAMIATDKVKKAASIDLTSIPADLLATLGIK